MRDEQPRWATVLWFEVFAVEAKGDPRLSVFEIVERKIRGVVAVGMSHDIGSVRLRTCKKCIERDAFPSGSELRPSRHAVQVDSRGFGWQLAKRFPIPSPQQRIVFVPDRKLPAIKRDMR